MNANGSILYMMYPLQALLIITIGAAWGIVLTRKFGVSWQLYGIGAATFVLSQVVHLPLNAGLTVLFQHGVLPPPPDAWQLPFNAVVLGFTAGLCEESARYFVYRWWIKEARSWREALLFGAGHGGVEAIILGGLALLTFFQLTAIRNADLGALIPAENIALAQQQVAAYWNAHWYEPLIGVFERACTLPVHLGFSVIVLQAFTHKQIRWLWLAIGWHMLVDAIVVAVMGAWGIFAAEAWVLIAALVSIFLIWRLRTPEVTPTPVKATPSPPSPLAPEDLPPVEETPEALQDTRFVS